MSAGLRALAVVALLAATRPADASPPLVLASTQRDSIGSLGLRFLTRGWTFTRDGLDLYVSGTVGVSPIFQLAHLKADPISGALTYHNGVPNVSCGLSPGSMALGPHEAELYCTQDRGNITVLRRDATTGDLTPLQVVRPASSRGFNAPVVVTPDGRHLLVPNGAAIAVIPRAPDGTLGDSVLVPTEPSFGVTGLAISPDGRFVYAIERGDGPDALVVFRRDAATGVLVRGDHVGDGFQDYVSLGGLRTIAASPDGRDLIAEIGDECRAFAFRLDAAGARITRARGVGCGLTAHASGPLVISPDGGLVLTTGSRGGIDVWLRDLRTGDVELVEQTEDGLGGIVLLGIESIFSSPDGRFVYVQGDKVVAVYRRRCGDSVVEADEACDDGNFSPGDGCDAACRVEPCFQCNGAPSTCMPAAGSCDDGNPCTVGDTCSGGACAGLPATDGAPCDDGNTCTTGDACHAGACVSSGHVTCSPCGVCDRTTARCVGVVERGCHRKPLVGTGAYGGTLARLPIGRLRRAGDANVLRLQWTSDEPATAEGIGDPTARTGYTICFLDPLTDPVHTVLDRQRRQILAETRVPSNAECTGARCWRRNKAGGFSYRSPHKPLDGVGTVRLAPDRTGRLDLVIRGRGGVLDDATPVFEPLVTQILADDGACWQGELKLSKTLRPASP